MTGERVLLALSGGVDSAVAAILLREQGYEVIAATMDTGFGESPSAAGEAARRLGIPHHVIDVRRDFSRLVIDGFVGDYERGRTPNPCVICNPLVKFSFMRELADGLGIRLLASGHYARLAAYRGRLTVRMAAQARKDQSYVLYRLPQELLARLIFPLGAYDKAQIRAIAREHGLAAGDKPDSQDICFIMAGDYRAFLQERGVAFSKGQFTDREGRPLGEHQGLQCYTVGQRRGLGVALGYPAFVCAIDAEQNRVVLGREEDLYASACRLEDIFLQGLGALDGPVPCRVKLRYKSAPCEALLSPAPEGGGRLEFASPQKAVTPGQSAVFYDGDIVLGGGIIARA